MLPTDFPRLYLSLHLIASIQWTTHPKAQDWTEDSLLLPVRQRIRMNAPLAQARRRNFLAFHICCEPICHSFSAVVSEGTETVVAEKQSIHDSSVNDFPPGALICQEICGETAT